MVKSARGNHNHQFRLSPYHLSSFRKRCFKKEDRKPKPSKTTMQKEGWKDATCSVCMEFPHNAVLLLCSSHGKGCRPYMCGATYQYSNCLDLYKEAYTKVLSPCSQNDSCGVSSWLGTERSVTELACPLCRGQVKGWTVVEPAREYLNSKRRSCMHDNCSFVGTYRELHRHMKVEHPLANPHKVDPTLEQKWTRLEQDREQEDVMSVIRTSMPGAVVWGDYVIETGDGSVFGEDVDEGHIDRDESNRAIRDGLDSNLLRLYVLLQAYENLRNDSGPRSASFASRLRRAALLSSAYQGEDGLRAPFLAEDAVNRPVASGPSQVEELPVNGIRRGRSVERLERRRRRMSSSRSNRGGGRGLSID